MKQLTIEKATEDFMTYGFKSFTTDDLAHKMGISKKTLYNYFKSKDILIEECLDYAFNNINHCHSALEKGDNIIEEVFDKMDQMPIALKISSNRPIWELKKYYPKIYQKFAIRLKELDYNYIYQLIQRGLKEGIFRDDIDIPFIQAFYYGIHKMREDPEVYNENEFSFWKTANYYNIYIFRILCNQKGIEILEKTIKNRKLK